MFEKVNPSHPDKLADRIAGALVDMAYAQAKDPRIAVEVLIGHGVCHIIAETSVRLNKAEIGKAVARITGEHMMLIYDEEPQDEHLAANQADEIRCGDNGIFKGEPATLEEEYLGNLAREIYERYPTDGKYIVNGGWLTVCQSNADTEDLRDWLQAKGANYGVVNPLGDWTGGPDVDTGATNRKLGSDMGRSVTGGGLHGKDLSKADVSVNIYAWLKAQELNQSVEMFCSIGDAVVDGVPYRDIVETARRFIKARGGFEKFAEWGLI